MEKQSDKKEKIIGTWLLFSFKGRISRKPFWVFNMVVFAAGMMFGLFTEPTEEINKYQLMFMLWIFWPSMAVQAKRWHDINKPAWWLLINFIPIAGPIWALIQNGCIAGTRGPNRFGPDPLEAQRDSDYI
jgi:uncharacterized membrane protein YhaH (DUF805 family)